MYCCFILLLVVIWCVRIRHVAGVVVFANVSKAGMGGRAWEGESGESRVKGYKRFSSICTNLPIAGSTHLCDNFINTAKI
jgi:hypothetical protein